MSKYIKLEDAISVCGAKLILADGAAIGQRHPTPDENINALLNLPTIDIVRCKDCKWRGVQNEPEGTCYYWCRNIGVGFAVDEWNYCCWGERSDMRGVE